MKKLKQILSHELISGTFYIFIGSMFANVMAFLLNLFFARNLSYEDYGTFASLLSIITLAMIAGNSITTIIVKFSARFYTKNEDDKLKTFYNKSAIYVLIFAFLIFLLFAITSAPLSRFLRLSNYNYLILTGLGVSVFYLQTLNMAFLQGMMKFGFISIVNAASSLIKLVVGIVLVFLGFRAFSGLWAILFMGIGAFLVGFIPLRKIFVQKTNGAVNLQMKEIVSFALPAFFCIFFMTSFTSTDVILAKHFFNPQSAAFYAGLSLVGKVIFYFTAPIPVVMFPILVKRHTTGSNFINIFYLSLFLVLLPSVAISIFYFLFPLFTIKLFLGGRDYYAISGYLGFFGIYLTVFSLVNVCVNFFLSLGKTKIIYPVLAAAIMQILLIFIFHADFYQIITVSFVVTGLLLLVLLLTFIKLYARPSKLKETVAVLSNPPV